MQHFEGWEGVARVDGVGLRRGERRKGERGEYGGCEGSFHGISGQVGRVNLNRTSTSSATVSVSAHGPSPILNGRRFMVNCPSTVRTPPASTSVKGAVMGCEVPLMVSAPVATNLPGPAGLTDSAKNLALGKASTFSQTF